MNPKPPPDRIAITGMGLVTALGLTAASSLAAIRGGISNFLEHETVLVHGDSHGTELNGAKIARIPELALSRHVHGPGRAAALLALAVRACIRDLPPKLLLNARWRLHTPLDDEAGTTATLLASDVGALPGPAIQVNETPSPASGRCQLFENLIQATTDLRQGRASVVLVGVADALCDDPVLEALADADRLKSGTNPEGIIAGEAAGVFVLELESQAAKRDAGILAYLTAWGRGMEPRTGATPSIATGLRQAFREALNSLACNGEEIDTILADLNGERARANEWAVAAANIFPRDGKARGLEHPADCAGDCGAAMGAVLMGTAIGMLVPSEPPAEIALCTSEEGGARRVICLKGGNASGIDVLSPDEYREPPAVVPAVIEQHCDDASFLWLIRQRLAETPHTELQDLKRADEQTMAHLNGLFVAGEAGWDLVKKALKYGDIGEFFTASYLACKSGGPDRMAYLLDAAADDIGRTESMADAFAWLSYDEAAPHIRSFLTAESPRHRYIGVAATAFHRRDPGDLLSSAAFDPDPPLKARALRAYGELGRKSRIDLFCLKGNFTAEDETVRFSAAWSAALAGDAAAVDILLRFVQAPSVFAEMGIHAAFRRLEREAALSFQEELARAADTTRLAVIAAGVIGDPDLVPWLLEQMKNPPVARAAGEAFSMITGLNFVSAGVEAARPSSEPAEDEGDDLAIADETLPWPNVELVTAWWSKNKAHYPSGSRHLDGKPITENNLQQILKTGRQGLRAAAAFELAMMEPGRPLVNVRARQA